ncbi:MAG TPA: ATP-binding protein [Anaerolineaceae bacterium]|nr:ATP-binding protein [Anaerolineaceae bacterium]HPN53449.1 ATP-binding protein [Anaerolineaceae bacterium]
MKRSLTLRLVLAFAIVSLAGIALAALFVWRATTSEFDRLVIDRRQEEFINFLVNYYEANGSWDGIAQALNKQTTQPLTDPHEGSKRSPFTLVDNEGKVLTQGGPFPLDARVSAEQMSKGAPVMVNNQQVGRLINNDSKPEYNLLEEQYIHRTNIALLVAGLVATLAAALLGLLMARTITRPLRELTLAAHTLAEGTRTGLQVAVRTQDEIGELAAAFNRMSADLQRASQMRMQMTADIAHDLRTPLTVITGYLESLRDGVLKPTQERFEVLYNEARHLQRLVEDLRTLSLTDAGCLAVLPQKTSPAELLEDARQAFLHRAEKANITLSVQAQPNLPDVEVDPERLEQVLGNLLSNALRYTPAGGCILLSAAAQNKGVAITVSDSGSGISAEALPHIFERFYRAEPDRAEQNGESGLGLAIARSLVELHGGVINAVSPGALGGAEMRIWLPLAMPTRPKANCGSGGSPV